MHREPKRFLSIRLTQDEFDKIQHHLQQSTCRSLTEYAKKVLTRRPVIIKTRDQTREDILHRLGTIRSLLDTLPGKIPPNVDSRLPDLLLQINFYFREIAQKCSR